METEPAHWFDLGRIAWEAPFTVSNPQPDSQQKQATREEKDDEKDQEPRIKCPMCGCTVKSS